MDLNPEDLGLPPAAPAAVADGDPNNDTTATGKDPNAVEQDTGDDQDQVLSLDDDEEAVADLDAGEEEDDGSEADADATGQQAAPEGDDVAKWRDRALKAEASQRAPAHVDVQIPKDRLDAAVARAIGPAPVEADYRDDNGVLDFLKFESAQQEWNIAARITRPQVERELKAEHGETVAAFQAKIDAHSDRLAAARKSIPNFDAVMSKGSAVKVEDRVLVEILESPKSALLAYALAQHPALGDRLNAMNERDLVREIGRLESKLELPKPRKVSKAAAPLKPVKGDGGKRPFDPEKASMNDYAADFRRRNGIKD